MKDSIKSMELRQILLFGMPKTPSSGCPPPLVRAVSEEQLSMMFIAKSRTTRWRDEGF
jgi:hypothetical protein